MRNKILGGVLIIVALALLGFVLYKNGQKRYGTIVFSPKLMLSSLWESYKKNYWEAGTGRTLDKQRGGITTSEGQSYTMLRAVWQDDKPTFDKSWEWTQNNLKRPNDHLFSWLYGQRPDGSYGVLDAQGGQNSAADADTDIAVALMFASNRWGDSKYLQQAKEIVSDIWDVEVVNVNNTPILAADNLEKNSATSGILVNPSYFAPYAYRMFAQIDSAHDWNAIIDSSYDILSKASVSSLDKTISSGLEPDWVVIDKKTGSLSAPVNPQLTTNYSFDALRVPFRLALDSAWFSDQRDITQSQRFYFLDQEWQSKKKLASIYSHDGQVITDNEVPASYAGALAYFYTVKRSQAQEIYKNKLESLYSADYQDWKSPLSYFDDNWTWLGLALYNNALVNLFPIPGSNAQK